MIITECELETIWKERPLGCCVVLLAAESISHCCHVYCTIYTQFLIFYSICTG
jgi:hypothetical protein